MKKTIAAVIAMTIFTVSVGTAFANSTDGVTLNLTPNTGVVFQVIQSQIILSCATVKSARLITSPSTYGVQLQLTPAAAKQFSKITKYGVGKIIDTVVNGKIVSSATIASPLGGDMLITQPTKMQAEQFIKSLGSQCQEGASITN